MIAVGSECLEVSRDIWHFRPTSIILGPIEPILLFGTQRGSGYFLSHDCDCVAPTVLRSLKIDNLFQIMVRVFVNFGQEYKIQIRLTDE